MSRSFQFCRVVDEICAFLWSSQSRDDMVDVAWAYYFFRYNSVNASRRRGSSNRLTKIFIISKPRSATPTIFRRGQASPQRENG